MMYENNILPLTAMMMLLIKQQLLLNLLTQIKLLTIIFYENLK